MLNKWEQWYKNLDGPQAYGSTETYVLAEEYLRGLHVEDWGCGKGFFKSIHNGDYVGVDGTETIFSDVVADLRTYTSTTEGLLMRHVLEHNFDWAAILNNAVESFTDKMVLVLFTPMANKTHQIAWNTGVEVPDMSFSHEDIMARIPDGMDVRWEDFATDTQYKTERVYWMNK